MTFTSENQKLIDFVKDPIIKKDFDLLVEWIKKREVYNRKRLVLYKRAWELRRLHSPIAEHFFFKPTPKYRINIQDECWFDKEAMLKHKDIIQDIKRQAEHISFINNKFIKPIKKKLKVRLHRGSSNHINAIKTMDYEVLMYRKEWEKD